MIGKWWLQREAEGMYWDSSWLTEKVVEHWRAVKTDGGMRPWQQKRRNQLAAFSVIQWSLSLPLHRFCLVVMRQQRRRLIDWFWCFDSLHSEAKNACNFPATAAAAAAAAFKSEQLLGNCCQFRKSQQQQYIAHTHRETLFSAETAEFRWCECTEEVQLGLSFKLLWSCSCLTLNWQKRCNWKSSLLCKAMMSGRFGCCCWWTERTLLRATRWSVNLFNTATFQMKWNGEEEKQQKWSKTRNWLRLQWCSASFSLMSIYQLLFW